MSVTFSCTRNVRQFSRGCLASLFITLAIPIHADTSRTVPTQSALPFAEVKVFGADGKPYRKPVENWEGAALIVKGNQGWRNWLAGRKQFIDDWMVKYRDHNEWVAGPSFDFTDSFSGSRLEWSADRPPPIATTGPEARLFGGWVALFRRTQAERMVEAARIYRLTGEKRFAEWAAAQLDFYADGYRHWPTRKRVGLARLGENSLDESNLVVKYAEVSRLLDSYPSRERRQNWNKNLFGAIGENLAVSFHGLNNISVWQRVAMAVIGLETQDSALVRQALDGEQGLLRMLSQGINSDYMWAEGSIAYGNYIVYAMLPLLQHAALSGDGSVWQTLSNQMVSVENMMLMPLYLRFPDGYAPTPSDGNRMKAPDNTLFLMARRVFPTTIGLDEERKRGTSWEALIDPPVEAGKTGSLPEVRSRNLEASRMAVLRKGNWQVFFHYGQSTKFHAQEEALTFEAYYEDVPVSYDTGSATGYGSALQEKYFSRVAAQNVPTVAGRGQESWAKGSLIAFEPERAVEAEQTAYRRDASAKRRLVIDGDTLEDIVTVSDHAKQSPGSSAGTVLNLNCDLTADDRSTGLQVLSGLPESGGFEFWKDVRSYESTDARTYEIKCSGKPLRLTFFLPGHFQVFVGTAPNVGGGTRTAFYVVQRTPSAIIRTRIEGRPK
jgi:oligo-alginate lyase